MQAFVLRAGLRPWLSAWHTRLTLARVLGVAGVVAYNWWLAALFAPGLVSSSAGFFSDLEVAGRPHAALLGDADVLAGGLVLVALLLRGPLSAGAARREWKWMLVFAVAGATGGRYAYACSEGLSASCRRLEWHLQLPLHHYVHVAAGIAEFAALTIAAVLAMRRTRIDGTFEARVFAAIVTVLAAGYPLLGAAYLSGRLGVLIEPVFFVTFSAMVLAELFEPVDRTPAGTELVRADRARS